MLQTSTASGLQSRADNPDGALDAGFDADGKILIPFGEGDDVGNAVVLQPDGKIIVGGNAGVTSPWRGSAPMACSTRLSAMRARQRSLLFGGRTIISIRLALQPDGRIIAVGTTDNSMSLLFASARFNTDGSVDSSFGNSGRVMTGIAGNSNGRGVTLQPDGKIVAVGYASPSTVDFALVCYLTNGAGDGSFNSTGMVTTGIGTGDDYGRACSYPD